MSKILDTLNRGGGELAELIRPLVNGQRASAASNGLELKPLVDLKPDPEPLGEAATTAAKEDIWDWIRTVRLRVPAPSPLLPFDADQQRPSEQYRILRTKITQDPRQPRLILISSPGPGDGKSVTTINMAAALSLKTEARALLVDADLRRSAAHILLGVPANPGLSEVLHGSARIEEALVHTAEFPNLYILPAGTPPENPAELFDSTRWPALCSRLREMFRFVAFDSPPVAAVADYDLIQTGCDAVAVVVRPDHTNRDLLQKAIEGVPKEKFLGIILNCVPKWSVSRHYRADHYYHYVASAPCSDTSREPRH